MKSLLLVACVGALLSWSAAYPVLRLERIPIAPRVSIPMALRLCGWNTRCLLNQDIIGIQNDEVQREYAAVVQLAILHELAGLVGHPDDSSDSSSNSSEEVPQVSPPEVARPAVDDSDDSDSGSRADPDEGHAAIHHIRVITVQTPLGARRLIIIRPITVVPDSDENVNTPEVVDTPDESRHNEAPAVPDEPNREQPEDDVADRSNVTPAPPASPEVTTDLTNSIERDSRGPTTDASEEDRRESLGDSVETIDQVEVFDPKKPARITGDDRYKYKAETPEIRQI